MEINSFLNAYEDKLQKEFSNFTTISIPDDKTELIRASKEVGLSVDVEKIVYEPWRDRSLSALLKFVNPDFDWQGSEVIPYIPREQDGNLAQSVQKLSEKDVTNLCTSINSIYAHAKFYEKYLEVGRWDGDVIGHFPQQYASYLGRIPCTNQIGGKLYAHRSLENVLTNSDNLFPNIKDKKRLFAIQPFWALDKTIQSIKERGIDLSVNRHCKHKYDAYGDIDENKSRFLHDLVNEDIISKDEQVYSEDILFPITEILTTRNTEEFNSLAKKYITEENIIKYLQNQWDIK